MFLIKRRSVNGMKKFIDGYVKYYNTIESTPEVQKLKDDNISHLLREIHELELSIDHYVFKYTHNISR